MATGNWSAQQLVEFVAAVSSHSEPAKAQSSALERAAEAVEAEFGAILIDGEVVQTVGFSTLDIPFDQLRAIVRGSEHELCISGLAPAHAVVIQIDDDNHECVIVARVSDKFSSEEIGLLRSMGRLLALILKTLTTLSREKDLRQASERQAAENAQLAASLQRGQLVKVLYEIQRAISQRSPVQVILDKVTESAVELIGDPIAALSLIDEENEDIRVTVSSCGFESIASQGPRRVGANQGIGGLAITQDKLVVIDSYESSPVALDSIKAAGAKTAMATPVRINGEVVGSLTVASSSPTRRYSAQDREMLLAFAEHATLALTDADTLERMHQAYHDPLTGLPNRALFLDRLEYALATKEATQKLVAVLFIDLDRFKLVNDSLGHAAGDELILAASKRLRGALRDEDVAARLGGDEFAVLLSDISDPEIATQIADRMLKALCAPFVVRNHQAFVTASVGISLAEPGEWISPSDLVRNADLAMYEAKNDGPGRSRFFNIAMHTAVMVRLELEAELQLAIDNDQLLVQYQPIVDLANQTIVGLEALVRWRHPRRGIVPPSSFISLAEETGQIRRITRYVMHKGCRDFVRWLEQSSYEQLFISFNLSSIDLEDPAIAPQIQSVFEEHSIQRGQVLIEITETSLMKDYQLALSQLLELKQLGVDIAIDDFGTGYSSLNHLRKLPVDTLKIDKSFIDAIVTNTQDQALVFALIGLSHSLSIKTIAEGVETAEQAEKIQSLGCQFGQGYYFAKPLNSDEVSRLLGEPALAVNLNAH